MKKVSIVLILLFNILLYFKSYSNDYLFDSTYAFNGTIKSIYNQNGVNYIGGSFDKISYITGFGTIVDNTAGAFSNNFPKINGRVNVAISDGNGGFYLGGEFTKIGSYDRLGLAQIDANGQLTNFAPKVNLGNYPFVYDMVINNNKIYVSGSFEGINNTSRKYIASMDLNGNLTNWNPIVNDEVFSLDVHNNVIYFGGNFTSVNSQTRYFGAAVDNNGTLLDWNPQANNNIRTIKVNNGKIYIAGSFTKIQNVVANRLVAMYPDGTILNNFPSFNNIIETISFYQNKIYIGGRFTKVNNLYRYYLAAIDTNGTILDWNPQADAKVNIIECDDSGVYVGGSFTNIAYQRRSSFAYISHTGILSNWNPNANSTGLAIALSNSKVFIGGLFNGLGGYERNHLVAIDSVGKVLNWNPNPNGDVYSVFGDNNSIYISGVFSKVGNSNISRFASLNVNSGEPNNFRPNIDGYVYSLIKYHDRIVIAGSFSKINGQTRTSIAAFDNDGNLMSFAPQINSSIFSMDNDGPNLYIGGFFTNVNGVERNKLACIDTAGVLQSFNPDVDNAIISLKYFKDKIYIGGWFETVAGQYRSKFAAINKNGTLTSLAPNPNNAVWSILTYSQPFDVIYIGGDFTSIFNQSISNLAAIDANGGLIPWYPNPDKSVFALSSSSTQVYAGGLFLSLENTLSPNFAILNTYNINPGKPSLVSPIDNSIKVPVKSRFDWTATEYTSSYKIQFSTDNLFANILLDSIVPINYLEIKNLVLNYDSKIYWRVRSLNSGGQSPWSNIWSFTTRIAPPLAPQLSLPVDNSIDISFGQKFEWDGSATTAESYQIQYSNESNFETITASDSAISSSFKTIPDVLMQPLKKHFWRVRGINESGPGTWSEVWSFTTAEFFVQQINMKVGWNLISSNILPNNDSLEKIFSQILDDVIIVKNQSGKVFIPEYNINSIGSWNILDAYQVYSKAVTSLNVLGYLVDPLNSTYQFKTGWNQISYLRNSPMDATIAFKSLVDAGILLMAKDGFGNVFIPDFEINQIGDLTPGKGFILYITSPTQFTYPANN